MQFIQNIVAWFKALSTIWQVIIVLAALVFAILASQAVFVLAVLFFVVGLIALIVQLVRRRPLRQWGIVTVSALVLAIVFGSISGAGNAPQQEAAKKEPAEEAAKEDPAEEPAEEEESAEKEEPQRTDSEEQQQTVSLNEPLAVGEVAWIVTDARRVSEISQERFGQFGKTKQGSFVIVDFSFTNNSDEPRTLDRVSINLLDSRERESRPDTDSFGYVPQELNPFLQQVNPGVTQDGRVIFTVAPDASGFKLRLGDAKLFTSDEGHVNLGF